MYWSLPPIPGTGNYKGLGALSEKSTKSIFCSFEVTLSRSWMGPGNWKAKPSLEAWDFWPHPSSSSVGRGISNGINWSCLHDKASPNPTVLESFQAGERVEGGWCAQRGQERSVFCPHALPDSSLPSEYSAITFSISFYKKPVKVNKMCPSSFDHSNTLTGPRTGVTGVSDL